MGGDLRMIKYILCALLGYFAGCFSPSYLLSRRRGFDIRTFGSGNAGATNMMLAAGLKPGLIVMALDVSKAFVVTFPLRLLLPPLCAALAGLLCVLGHIFPVFLRFRGGKGTACLCGTVLGLTPELVLPLLANKLFGIVEVLLDTKISDSLANIIYYYVLFAIVLLLFHSFLAHTTSRFLGGVSRAMTTFCMGLLVFYGANELFYRVANVLFNSRTNLNDMTIAASINAAPRLTALIIVFLAPFVEEVLFRGLVFGCLKEKSRVAAYVISCVLFAFMHVWTFALSSWDWSYLILMLQYLVPGLVFAWAFDHSGTLWTSILLHATVNALALWAIVG